MINFLRNIPGNLTTAVLGGCNTAYLGVEGILKTQLWQKTGGVAFTFFKDSADAVYPTALRFNPTSRDAAGGALTTICIGALINYARRNDHSTNSRSIVV